MILVFVFENSQIIAGSQCILKKFPEMEGGGIVGNTVITGKGKLLTGIPVFEISVYRYEKYRYPHTEVLHA